MYYIRLNEHIDVTATEVACDTMCGDEINPMGIKIIEQNTTNKGYYKIIRLKCHCFKTKSYLSLKIS
jgi:hypothetical protein